MDRYTLIDWDNLTIWDTSDLNDINQGGSDVAVSLDDLIDLIKARVEEEKTIYKRNNKGE